jgi:glycolate oxidase FAD binding subunit
MSCEIDGKSFPIAQPESVRDLCQIVRDTAAQGQAIYPVGGRTMLNFGLPPSRDGIALETTRLDRVIDYPSRDMTITVEAGIRVAKLQEILRSEGQRLPVDVPRAAEATLGGAIAANVSGPRRYAFGTFRDYVIGISVIDAAGNETKAGGRVVKNVAGYDLCKLYTGSLGTLGIITQVTLKLRPRPESAAVAWISPDRDDAISQVLDRLASSRTRPTAIDLLNHPAANHILHSNGIAQPPASHWVLAVGFEENADAVTWQQEQLRSELKGLDIRQAWFEGEQTQAIWDALIEFQVLSPEGVSFKANVPSSAVLDLLKMSQRQPIAWAVQAHAGNGIAYGHSTIPGDFSAVESALAELRSFAVSQRGNLVLRSCPVDWKTRLPVWGQPRGDAWLIRAIQRKLDPNGLWNPGRFIDSRSNGAIP